MIIAYSNQLVQWIAMVHLPFNEQHFWTCVIQVLTALFTADMVLGLWDHVKDTVEVVEEVVDQLTFVEVDEKNWVGVFMCVCGGGRGACSSSVDEADRVATLRMIL